MLRTIEYVCPSLVEIPDSSFRYKNNDNQTTTSAVRFQTGLTLTYFEGELVFVLTPRAAISQVVGAKQ